MANFQKAEPQPLLNDYESTNLRSSDFATRAYGIQQFKNFSFQTNVTSQTGLSVTAKVQATLDNVNWCDVPSSAVTLNANGSYMWNFSGAAYIAVRMYFTFAEGSALFQVWAFVTT